MKYWIIKGNPKWYKWDDNLTSAQVEDWHSRSLPADLASGDRLFLWESGGKSRVIGFGEVVRIQPNRDKDGLRVFDIRYLTARFQMMPSIDELRKIPILKPASFLAPGPFATVYALSTAQARALYQLVVSYNRQDHIWRDLGGGKISAPAPELEIEVLEGNPKLSTHFRRERDPSLSKKKKEQFRRDHQGRLFCEACGNDHAAYGKLADSAFEVHHFQQIGSRKKATKTKLVDLGVLCATCHRVIHRTAPMSSIASFRRRINAR